MEEITLRDFPIGGEFENEDRTLFKKIANPGLCEIMNRGYVPIGVIGEIYKLVKDKHSNTVLSHDFSKNSDRILMKLEDGTWFLD